MTSTLDSMSLSRRDKLRRDLAAAILAGKRYGELTRAIATVEERKERIAAEHVAACKPMQTELAQIDSQQVEAIIRGEDCENEVESRRHELLAKVRAANVELETRIAGEDRLLSELRREQREVGFQGESPATIRHSLCRSASAALRIRVRILENAATRAHLYLDKLQESQTGDSDYTRALIQFAAEEFDRLQKLSQEAYQAAVDEP